MAITRRLVATAFGIDSPPSKASAGTTRKPPPAPTRPVTKPTIRPSRTMRNNGSPACGRPVVDCLRPRIIATAVTAITTPKAARRSGPGRSAPIWPPTKAPAMPAAPKMTPVFHRTLPARACAIRPNSDVTATTNKLAVIACFGSNPATYTSSGVVRMEPPPPRSPRVSPTTRASAAMRIVMVA